MLIFCVWKLDNNYQDHGFIISLYEQMTKFKHKF